MRNEQDFLNSIDGIKYYIFTNILDNQLINKNVLINKYPNLLTSINEFYELLLNENIIIVKNNNYEIDILNKNKINFINKELDLLKEKLHIKQLKDLDLNDDFIFNFYNKILK